MNSLKIWANLAVQDTARTDAFYHALGIAPNGAKHHVPGQLVSFRFGADFIIHFFQQEVIASNTDGAIVGNGNGSEVLFSIAADTQAAVDDWAKRVRDAGGTIFKEPQRDKAGFYWCGFADPDGHKFNVLLVEKGM